MTPALSTDPETGALLIREECGLDHERQIVAVSLPPNFSLRDWVFFFRDEKTGRDFPAQRSRENPRVAFLQLELRAGDDFKLVARDRACAVDDPVVLSAEENSAIVSNGNWAVEIFIGEWKAAPNTESTYAAPTPIRRLRVKNGPWRGHFFFDTRHAVREIRSTVVESGPLRVVTQFEASIGQGIYAARLTFDAGADFIVVDEKFNGESGDQIVWDFSGADLPEIIHLLDSTAGFTTQPLHYFYDRRLARLACWNQYSQLHDFSDGYALKFSQSDDILGLVALRGGEWDGNAHNFLEAWTRRWYPGDPGSRRLVPPEAKADAAPSPERIPARPANQCESHFSIEGWLHRGRRIFAIVLTSEHALRSADWNLTPPLGHFEEKPDRPRYRQQQSLLRRIHTQHGLFSFADRLALAWSWSDENPSAHENETAPPWLPRDPLTFLPKGNPSIPERREQIWEFLSARVYGFWEGSGSAYTNAVVNRRLAEDLIAWEWLGDHGHLDPDQQRQGSAWFVFLSQLLSSDHYYPGAALMSLGDASKSMEPTIAGMANQNFFTDIYNFPGIAAQVYADHPDAPRWRERFTHMWRRQMEYHVYAQSGVWEESHTYFHHVLQTLLPTFIRRREDGVEDAFAEPSLQRAVASLLKMLTPRDACFGGKRHVVALGDHGVDLNDLYRPLYRMLSEYIAPSNPDLAAQLGWAYMEMGGDESLTVKPKAIAWQNEYVQGLGYFFRDLDAGGESLMVLRCGSAWAHHHNDEGSLHYFHSGRAWIVDSAFSYPQETGIRKVRADGHSRWAPRDLDPLNYLWQFNRGWIIESRGEGPFPYAVAHTPIYMAETSAQQYIPLRRPILHRRAVVQLAPSAFLILDYSDQILPQVTRFHLPLDAPYVLEDAPASSVAPYLRVRSLAGLYAPQSPTIDRPTQAGDTYATREIRYAWKDQMLSALIIAIENASPDSKLQIQAAEKSAAIRSSEFAVTCDFGQGDQVILRDENSNREFPITLGLITPTFA